MFFRKLKWLGRSFLDLCLPRLCSGCEKTWLSSQSGSWCKECLDTLPWVQSPLCPRCGRPFIKSAAAPDHYCGACLQASFEFDWARSATLHSGVVRDRIHKLKFGAQLHWAPPLVELLVRVLEQEEIRDLDCILPVPLHVKRLKQRGFNQAGLIAGVLSRKIRRPVSFNVLARKSWTDPQTRLKRQERLENVKGAFGVVRPSFVKDLDILLIDDVYTTGSTLNECAKTLKKAGAAKVYALTVSRALPEWRADDAAIF